MTARTPIHVASLTKQFTAHLVAELMSDGLLHPGQRVGDVLPWLSSPVADITVQEALWHTAALPDQWELLVLAGWRLQDVITQQDVEARIRGISRLLTVPGTQFRYSNTGYTLAALCVSTLLQRPFEQALRELVLLPAGMNDSRVVADWGHVSTGRADSYCAGPDGSARRVGLAYATAGASNLETTLEDLTRWEQAQLAALRRPPLQGAHRYTGSRGTLRDGTDIDYGFGLSVLADGPELSYRHGGVDAGYRAFMIRRPRVNLSVIVLSNFAECQPATIADALMYTYLDEGHAADEKTVKMAEPTRPALPPLIIGKAINGDDASELTGSWVSDELGTTVRIDKCLDSGALDVHLPVHGTVRLTPSTPTGACSPSARTRACEDTTGVDTTDAAATEAPGHGPWHGTLSVPPFTLPLTVHAWSTAAGPLLSVETERARVTYRPHK